MSEHVARAVSGAVFKTISNGLSSDFKSRNWSVYGQWLGVACFIVDIILGAVNLLHLSVVIVFGILAIVQGLMILFLEVPFLMRICPVTDRFTSFIKFFHQNLPRAGFYILLAAIQYGSLGIQVTSLLACAILMTGTSLCYLLAYITKQEFVTSATLGGDGVPAEILP